MPYLIKNDDGDVIAICTYPQSGFASEEVKKTSKKYKDASSLLSNRKPMILTAYQVRKVLNAVGKRDEVEAAIAAADIETQDAWNYASQFERLHPLVVSMGSTLSMTPAELDKLFTDGAEL